MRVRAEFSDGLRRQLNGMAIGDEFDLTAKARITGAEEVLIDITSYGSGDTELTQGELEVTLLLSHGEVQR